VEELAAEFRAVRAQTDRLAEPLGPEDATIQSMTDASPSKWHLAHTSWFFETLILDRKRPGYAWFDAAYPALFNSYYNTLGPQHPRPARGMLSRPTLAQIRAYRAHVDREMKAFFESAGTLDRATVEVIEVGMNHEQQHQELLLTDLKHLLSLNPLRPAYRDDRAVPRGATPAPLTWRAFPAGLVSIGYDGERFAYDNEKPRHQVYLQAFELASRPITNAEYLAFMTDGGYRRPEFWLSDGWATVQGERWEAPLYWERRGDEWWQFTLRGMQPVDPHAPVCHVSLFEADAYARWAGARLPTEAEWEAGLGGEPAEGQFVESEDFHPTPAPAGDDTAFVQAMGSVWEWTRSGYEPYPGYVAPAGPLGEYNSKFMCSQVVLRGGSCATPRSHLRPTYRNFFFPGARWQFSGIRLARDLS